VPNNDRSWLQMALARSVVLRGFKVSAVVGTLLVTINHLPAIWSGDLSRTRLLQIGLTYLVPYCVATWSSVSALREAGRKTTEAASESGTA
jgi:hypothetical protein